MKARHRRPGAAVDVAGMTAVRQNLPDVETTYTCRICFEESRDASQLISPCLCKGHTPVLKRHWNVYGRGDVMSCLFGRLWARLKHVILQRNLRAS